MRTEFDRLEVAHGKFVLYSRKDGQGTSKLVESIFGFREFSAETVGFSVVKSIMTGKFHLFPLSKSLEYLVHKTGDF